MTSFHQYPGQTDDISDSDSPLAQIKPHYFQVKPHCAQVKPHCFQVKPNKVKKWNITQHFSET